MTKNEESALFYKVSFWSTFIFAIVVSIAFGFAVYNIETNVRINLDREVEIARDRIKQKVENITDEQIQKVFYEANQELIVSASKNKKVLNETRAELGQLRSRHVGLENSLMSGRQFVEKARNSIHAEISEKAKSVEYIRLQQKACVWMDIKKQSSCPAGQYVAGIRRNLLSDQGWKIPIFEMQCCLPN